MGLEWESPPCSSGLGVQLHMNDSMIQKKKVWKFCLKDLFMTEETMSEKIGHYSTKFRNQNATSMFKTVWA